MGCNGSKEFIQDYDVQENAESRALNDALEKQQARHPPLARATFARNLGGRGRHAVEGVGGAGMGLRG